MSITRALAAFVTLTAVSMAAVAAWDRGGSAIDRALLVAVSAAICIGAHLIPALSQRKLAWLLWIFCLLGTVYGHVTFFTHASLRAGKERAQHSAQVIGTAQQIEAAQAALDAITARPVSVVAAEIAVTKDWRVRSALKVELSEAKRAAALRDELVRLAGTITQAEVTATDDPVTGRIATVTGTTEAAVSLAIGVSFAMLLELVGALLWVEALQKATEKPKDGHTASADPLTDLRAAIAGRRCKPTVASIRAFIGCSQARAMELRRSL